MTEIAGMAESFELLIGHRYPIVTPKPTATNKNSVALVKSSMQVDDLLDEFVFCGYKKPSIIVATPLVCV